MFPRCTRPNWLPAGAFDHVADFRGRAVFETFALLLELLVHLDRGFLHDRMRLLRAADEHEVFAASDPLVTILVVEADAEERRFTGFELFAFMMLLKGRRPRPASSACIEIVARVEGEKRVFRAFGGIAADCGRIRSAKSPVGRMSRLRSLDRFADGSSHTLNALTMTFARGSICS